ncbi:P-loop containing nucleoside triphosphate hydrolase protein [Xylariaceae sp. FL1272]|nr:P-loop containing nucleoside triphosphate hydrolase protein [Xylariaceae sp. FL1272]
MPSASSSKRSRRAAFADDDDADEYTVTQSATSNLRGDSSSKDRKKARLSAPPRKHRRAPDPGDDEPMPEPDREPSPPPATQYELARDQGFKHLDHTEEDDQRATQRLRDRPTIIGDNHAAQNAIIEEITCINFMCHTKLRVQLGPLLNFVVGENGSGKSAVLTAITLCLGGKASATNRGGSLRSFVKEGEEHASLVIKLKNQGEDAYKPDVYGDSITCERWFTKSGGSGFRLKSTAGRLISTKKADVEDIVEWYCLQVDNPLNVLSQDNARQFLNAATPAMKYGYFIKGTQLEQLDDDYKQYMQSLDDHESKVVELDENLTYLKQEFEKAVKLRDAASRATEMRQRGQVYKNQLAWAQVKEQEDILGQKENAILAAQEDIDRAGGAIAQTTQSLAHIDDKIQHAKNALESAQQEKGQADERKQEARDRFDQCKAELALLQTEERDLKGNLDQAAAAVEQLENAIRAEESLLQEKSGGIVAEKQRELDQAKETEEQIQQSIQEHSDRLKTLQNEREKADVDAKEPETRLRRKRKEVQDAEAALQASQQNRTDPLDGFGRPMLELLRLINNDKNFTQKPVGPLGIHIQLTRPQWMPVFEKQMGGALNGFIVQSKSDQVRLMGLMDRVRIQNSPVFIGNPSIRQLREPDEKYDTMLRVLEFSDQRVRDHLIIQQKIEQILLIESRVEAEEVMFAAGGPPENSSACLALNDRQKGHGMRITNNRGNLSTNPISPNLAQRPRMKTDDGRQIEFYKNLVAQLQEELVDVEKSRRIADQAIQRAEQAVSQHKKQGERLSSQLKNARVGIRRIEEELDSFDGSDDRLQGLKDQLKDAEERQDQWGNQFGEVAVRKKEKNVESEAIANEVKSLIVELKDHEVHVNKATDKVKRYEDTRRIALSEKNAAHETEAMAKVAKTQAEASRDRQATYVAEYNEQASRVAPERAYIPEGENYQTIEQKYNQIRTDLQRLRGQMGASEEEINNRAVKATQEYRDAKASFKNVQSGMDLMKKSLMDRLAKFREFQRHVSAQARCNFGYLLSERGFRGQLLLDHRAKKLEVIVEPDKTRENGKGRNTKTLSGGEKSFSSICLLLAIWDAMGSPLRCLDEFDVFMDNVNRAISTNMLIAAARRSVGKQFILITPNAIEGRANLDKDVKIIRLTDPRQQRIDNMIQ